MTERLNLRSIAALIALVALLALPATALGHPADAGQTPGQPQAEHGHDGGGTSPLLIAAVVVSGVALAGGLYAVKQAQTRSDAASGPDQSLTAE